MRTSPRGRLARCPSPPDPPRTRPLADLLDPARDLLLGSRCLGCERPGRLVCAGCRAGLVPHPAPAWPTPVPAGLVQPWAARSYEGLPRALVLGLKEHGLLALAQPLGELMAAAVGAALLDRPAAATTLLVPVPSRARTVRARGHDAVGTVTRRAAGHLQAWPGPDQPVLSTPLLRLRPGVVDQSGLDAAARHRNLAGSMACSSDALRRLSRAVRGPVRVVVCDDVITTGATLREAQRALEAVGLVVVATAAVAATRRRSAGRPGVRAPEAGEDQGADSWRNFR